MGLLRLGFKVRFHDAQCGFKGISRKAAALLNHVENNTWFFDTELLIIAEALGMPIAEIPVTWNDDLDSRVKILPVAMENIGEMIRLRKGLPKVIKILENECSDLKLPC
jgi:hypothetical protein